MNTFLSFKKRAIGPDRRFRMAQYFFKIQSVIIKNTNTILFLIINPH